ncbi:MAG: hypothetical protein H6679_02090 [Epsilonproteobacteria bacterium]|nr:hypothetical protein [Campylobacterota bacterium]
MKRFAADTVDTTDKPARTVRSGTVPEVDKKKPGFLKMFTTKKDADAPKKEKKTFGLFSSEKKGKVKEPKKPKAEAPDKKSFKEKVHDRTQPWKNMGGAIKGAILGN